MAQFDLISLRRGGQGYVIDDFVFIKKDIRGPSTRLRCQMYKPPPTGRSCPAAANVRNGAAHITNPNHNHAAPSLEANLRQTSNLATFGADQRIARFCEEYFWPTWFAGTFPLASWTFYKSPARTTNNVESFHCGLKKYFQRPHMTTYKFLVVLLQYAQTVAYNFDVRAAAGNPAPVVRRRYRTVNRAFDSFHNNIWAYNTVQYLRGIANMVPAPTNM